MLYQFCKNSENLYKTVCLHINDQRIEDKKWSSHIIYNNGKINLPSFYKFEVYINCIKSLKQYFNPIKNLQEVDVYKNGQKDHYSKI